MHRWPWRGATVGKHVISPVAFGVAWTFAGGLMFTHTIGSHWFGWSIGEHWTYLLALAFLLVLSALQTYDYFRHR